MVVDSNRFNRVNNIPGNSSVTTGKQLPKVRGGFGRVLQEAIEKGRDVKFSKHAELRLQSRRINLSDSQMDRLNEGVNKADKKGVKDSLVLVDDVALVVNVKSRTVITAVSSGELKENAFTNIDGAVIV